MTDNKISTVRFRRINEWMSRCTFIAEVLEFQLESSKHSESHQIRINRVQFILQWYNHMRSRDTGDSILNANQLTPYAGNSLMFNLSSSNVRLEILLKRSQKTFIEILSISLCASSEIIELNHPILNCWLVHIFFVNLSNFRMAQTVFFSTVWFDDLIIRKNLSENKIENDNRNSPKFLDSLSVVAVERSKSARCKVFKMSSQLTSPKS